MGAAGDRTERVRLWAAVALALGAAALYAKSVPYPWSTLDDPHYVTVNDHVATGLSVENAVWAFTTGYESNWHPLTWLSLQFDAAVFGPREPNGFRAHNIALHAASTALLFWALSGMTGSIGRSAVVAALFGVHPQHVESVAWITERKDVLSGFFGMLALCAYGRYARGPSGPRFALVAGFLALGLMAKPMLVTLPFALLLLDYWPLGRTPWVRAAAGPGPVRPPSVAGLALEKAPLVAVVVASAAITFLMQSKGGSTAYPVGLPVRVANAVESYVEYLRQTVAPVDLCMFYPYPEPRPQFSQLRVQASALALAAVTAAAVALRRGAPYLLVGWLWYLGTLVPMIGIVQVGNQARADRYMYLPHVGLFLAMVWGAADLMRLARVPAVVRGLVGVAVVAATAAACDTQLGHWRSNVALWEHGIAVTSEQNARARENLGSALVQEKRFAEGEPHLRYAVTHNYPYARLGVAVALMDRGRPDEGIEFLLPFLQFRPDYAPANLLLVDLLIQAGRAAEAVPRLKVVAPDSNELRYAETIAAARQALAGQRVAEARALLAPIEKFQAPEATVLLARCDEAQGRYDAAVARLREVVAKKPTFAPAQARLAVLLGHLGKTAEALVAARTAVELRPNDPLARAELGMLLADAGNATGAGKEYEAALAVDPRWPLASALMAWQTLLGPDPTFDLLDARLRTRQACEATGFARPEVVAAYAAQLAESGVFPEAERVLAPAVAAAETVGNLPLAQEMTQQLAQYKARRKPREWKKLAPKVPAPGPTAPGPPGPPPPKEFRIE